MQQYNLLRTQNYSELLYTRSQSSTILIHSMGPAHPMGWLHTTPLQEPSNRQLWCLCFNSLRHSDTCPSQKTTGTDAVAGHTEQDVLSTSHQYQQFKLMCECKIQLLKCRGIFPIDVLKSDLFKIQLEKGKLYRCSLLTLYVEPLKSCN